MLAQVLGAERERFLLGVKNTYILEGNWPAGADPEVCLDRHRIQAELMSGEKEEELSRSEEAIRLLGEKKILTIQLPEGWEKARQLTVYAVEKDRKNVWFRISVRDLKRKQKSPQFYLDEEVIDPRAGRLHISGWAVDQGPVKIALFDHEKRKLLCRISRNARPDVVSMYGECAVEANCGFSLDATDLCGDAVYLVFSGKNGKNVYPVSLKAPVILKNKVEKYARKGLSYWRAHGTEAFVSKTAGKLRSLKDRPIEYEKWFRIHAADKKELERERKTVFDYQPLISIVVPLYNTPEPFLKALIDSITAQTYGKFELCLADGSTDEKTAAFVEKQYGSDKRIRLKRLAVNGGISENTNEAIRMASGEFLLFSDHDDFLEPNALFELVQALNQDPALDLIYTDEDLSDEKGEHYFSPRMKPDFNPDFLRCINYICHLTMVRRSLAEEVGLLRKECDGAQDYDFLLRCIEKTDRVFHIPKVLYHWRASETSTAGNQDSKTYAIEAGKKALTEHYARLGYEAEVEYTGIFILYKMRLKVKGEPLVTILIPNKDQAETLDTCVKSIYEKTDYPHFEILVVENNSEKEETFAYYEKMEKEHENFRVVRYEGGFNYSAINNFGARHANGDYLLLLNNDTEVISPFWIREMVGFCQREDTGAVGAKLYYPDGLVQHCGVVVGIANFAGHVQNFHTRQDAGYFGRLKAVQDISAVTAACMLVKKSVFDAIGGFDESFVVSLNDVDLCLRIRKAGKLIVQDPNVELYHYESKSRGYENTPEKKERFKQEILRFRRRWKSFLDQGDPYYSPNLSLMNGECQLRKEKEVPVEWKKLFPHGEEAEK